MQRRDLRNKKKIPISSTSDRNHCACKCPCRVWVEHTLICSKVLSITYIWSSSRSLLRSCHYPVQVFFRPFECKYFSGRSTSFEGTSISSYMCAWKSHCRVWVEHTLICSKVMSITYIWSYHVLIAILPLPNASSFQAVRQALIEQVFQAACAHGNVTAAFGLSIH